MSNSIWDNKPVASTEKDYSNSKFLDKRLIGVPEGMTLKFTGLIEKDQKPETEDQYKTKTGTTWFFYFRDEKDAEYELEQKNEAGKFYVEMQKEKVEIGEVINIKREGTGFETVWTITRVGVDVKPVAEAPANPF